MEPDPTLPPLPPLTLHRPSPLQSCPFLFFHFPPQLINTIAASRGSAAVLSLATQKAGKQLLTAYGIHAGLTFIYITALGIVGENLGHRLRVNLFAACKTRG